MIASFKPKISQNYNAFCSASESNNILYIQSLCLVICLYCRDYELYVVKETETEIKKSASSSPYTFAKC